MKRGPVGIKKQKNPLLISQTKMTIIIFLCVLYNKNDNDEMNEHIINRNETQEDLRWSEKKII